MKLTDAPPATASSSTSARASARVATSSAPSDRIIASPRLAILGRHRAVSSWLRSRPRALAARPRTGYAPRPSTGANHEAHPHRARLPGSEADAIRHLRLLAQGPVRDRPG